MGQKHLSRVLSRGLARGGYWPTSSRASLVNPAAPSGSFPYSWEHRTPLLSSFLEMRFSLSIFQDQLLSWFLSCLPGCCLTLQRLPGLSPSLLLLAEPWGSTPASPLHTNGCQVSCHQPRGPDPTTWPLKTGSALIVSEVSRSPLSPFHPGLPPDSHRLPAAPGGTAVDRP